MTGPPCEVENPMIAFALAVVLMAPANVLWEYKTGG